jgi:hypothetical protein
MKQYHSSMKNTFLYAVTLLMGNRRVFSDENFSERILRIKCMRLP